MSLEARTRRRPPSRFDEARGVTLPHRPGGRPGFLSDVIVELGLAPTRTSVDEARRGEPPGRQGCPRRSAARERRDHGGAARDRAIAERNGLPYVDLFRFPVDDGAQRLIGSDIARRYRAAPIAFDDDGALVVALADPLDALAVSDIGVITKSEVRTAVATESGIDALLATMPTTPPPKLAPEPAEPNAEATASAGIMAGRRRSGRSQALSPRRSRSPRRRRRRATRSTSCRSRSRLRGSASRCSRPSPSPSRSRSRRLKSKRRWPWSPRSLPSLSRRSLWSRSRRWLWSRSRRWLWSPSARPTSSGSRTAPTRKASGFPSSTRSSRRWTRSARTRSRRRARSPSRSLSRSRSPSPSPSPSCSSSRSPSPSLSCSSSPSPSRSPSPSQSRSSSQSRSPSLSSSSSPSRSWSPSRSPRRARARAGCGT